jgi:hypothetical protein
MSQIQKIILIFVILVEKVKDFIIGAMMEKYRIKPTVVDVEKINTSKEIILNGYHSYAVPGEYFVTFPNGLELLMQEMYFDKLFEEINDENQN